MIGRHLLRPPNIRWSAHDVFHLQTAIIQLTNLLHVYFGLLRQNDSWTQAFSPWLQLLLYQRRGPLIRTVDLRISQQSHEMFLRATIVHNWRHNIRIAATSLGTVLVVSAI
jgi:hypothetical protein